MSHQAMLSTNDLAVGYRNGKRISTVLEHINVSLYPGELVCLLGANGIGKSTLLRCATMLETMDGGELKYLGDTAVSEKINERICRKK